MRKGTNIHNQPLVSIILPVKDGERYLSEALESIIAQTYSHWEAIVVDDGSQDMTPDLLKAYASKDQRITVITNKTPMGISHALNKGISKARGKYLARMDGDDISYPKRLEKQVAYLERHPEIVAIGTQCDIIDAAGRKTGIKDFPLTHREIYETVFRFNPLQHPTLMINRSLLPYKFVYYDVLDGAEDLNLLFKLFPYGKVANMKQVLLAYRLHGNNSSFRHIKHIYMQALAARMQGVIKYGYKPSLFSIIMTIAQSILVILLPEHLLQRLYFYTRGIKTQYSPSTRNLRYAPGLS